MKLHVSPCPNDCFIVHAMKHGLVDTDGMTFELVFDDIDRLNRAAIEHPDTEEIVKISYAALPLLTPNFRILDAGSALGRGNGPLLVTRAGNTSPDLAHATVAIPGEHTTANALLSRLFPEIHRSRKKVYLFSDIAQAIARSEVDAGVLIHEGRFTYQAQGLQLIADLGSAWERATRLPIPLGGLAIHRNIAPETARTVSRIVRQSIEYGFDHPSASGAFVAVHARELEPDVRRKHIDYFVNDHSLALNAEARAAIFGLTGIHPEFI